MIKVKIFDEGHESDLETAINDFIEQKKVEVIDIKYQVAVSVFSEEQVFCFSAMIIYN
ncbi:MAG: sporulation protein Cse60 [Bacilli bacterium]